MLLLSFLYHGIPHKVLTLKLPIIFTVQMPRALLRLASRLALTHLLAGVSYGRPKWTKRAFINIDK